MKKRVLFIVNVDWFFLSHRLPIAQAAAEKGYEVHIATSLTQPINELENLGFQIHPIKLNRGKYDIFSILVYFFRIITLIPKIKPDLIHLVTIKPVLIGGIASRILRVPSVLYAISGMGYVFIGKSFFHKILRKLISVLYKFALNHKNSIVVFQNTTDKRDISHIANLDKGSCEMIKGSGVDINLYEVTDLPNGKPIIMFASRLIKDKGIYEFVNAAKDLVISENNALRFVIVGDIDPENKSSLSKQELQSWVDEGVIEHWGFQTDMFDVLSKASLVVLPSYREGLPKVLIEAAACGRAVLTTDVPGCRDAIIPNITGRLVPVRDASALKAEIKQLINDRGLLTKMGIEGRKLAVEKFDLSFVIEKHLNIYQSLIRNIS